MRVLDSPDIDMSDNARVMLPAVKAGIIDPTFPQGAANKQACLAAYRQRTEEVKVAVPPEQLLIFDVAEGWEPLCAFLDVPVPDEPFPNVNDTENFWKGFGGEPPDPDLA